MPADIHLLGVREKAYRKFLSDYTDCVPTDTLPDIGVFGSYLDRFVGLLSVTSDSLGEYSDAFFQAIVEFVGDSGYGEGACSFSKNSLSQIILEDYRDKLFGIIEHSHRFIINADRGRGLANTENLKELILASYTQPLRYFLAFILNKTTYLSRAKSCILSHFTNRDDLEINFSAAGDYHNGGQYVFSFRVGSQEYYFKPRANYSDVYAAHFLEWFSKYTGIKPVIIPSSCNLGHYSIHNAIETHETYYENLISENDEYMFLCAAQIGQMIYTFWLLGISDISMDNYGLCSGGITLFDTEAVTISRLSSDKYNDESYAHRYCAINDGFLSQLTLPNKQKFQKGVFDFSMLGDLLSKVGAKESERKRKFINHLIDSLRKTQQAFIKNKKEFHHLCTEYPDNVPLEFRIVPRPTCDYGHLIELLCKPLYAGDKDQRNVILSALLNNIEEQPWNEVFLKEEIQTLSFLEIPFFYRNLKDAHLYSQGRLLKENYFLCGLDEESLLRVARAENLTTSQIRMTEISAAIDGVPYDSKRYWLDHQSNNDPIWPNDCLETVLAIAKFIQNGAMKYDFDYFWPTPLPLDKEGFVPAISNSDLYTGSAGIAVFYAALFKVTQDKTYYDLSKTMLDSIEHSIYINITNSVGFLDGQAGLIFASNLISQFINEPSTSHENELIKLTEKIIGGRNYDFSQGSSGLIYTIFSSNITDNTKKELIKILADDILSSTNSNFSGFTNPVFENKVLGGFAHGEAGIAYAFYLAYETTGNLIYADYARDCFQREIRRFKNSEYFDGRTKDGSVIPTSWCFGSSGVFLSSILCKSILTEETFSKVRELHSDMICRYEENENDWCLCHGRTSIVECKVFSKEDITWPSLKELICGKDGHVMQDKDVWLLTPGLFTGLSGIGYTMLRSLHPQIIPSLFSFKHTS